MSPNIAPDKGKAKFNFSMCCKFNFITFFLLIKYIAHIDPIY